MATIVEKSRGTQAPPVSFERRARRHLQRIYRAAVSAAQPSLLLQKKVRISDGCLLIRDEKSRLRFPLSGKVYLLGVGKGADQAAPVWKKLLGDRLERGMFIVRDRLTRAPIGRISIVTAGHPLPDNDGLSATRKALRVLSEATADDCVIVFLMGGASSLLVQPAPGLTLADKRAATETLLKSGLGISEINCVRKHLSGVKAGGLLRAAYPARTLTLAISDVVGAGPSVIGSAPSFHDPTTFKQAGKILMRRHLLSKIPARVKSHLLQGVRGEIPETLKPGNFLSRRSAFVTLGSNRVSLNAAKKMAESLGFGATVLTSTLSGDARSRAREICRKLKAARDAQRPGGRPRCLLLGGETTVRVRGKGLGGRNQEFALASAVELRGRPGIHLLSAGSDGSDGPTDAAGAFADGDTCLRARTLGLDPYAALRNNDSYRFFRDLGDLFRPGPTGTNVSDFIIALVY